MTSVKLRPDYAKVREDALDEVATLIENWQNVLISLGDQNPVYLSIFERDRALAGVIRALKKVPPPPLRQIMTEQGSGK